MSSGNLVSVIYVPETVYGTPDTPLSAVTAETARFTSETVSGTPETTVSQNIRTDRNSSGMVVTGLDTGGPIEYELASGQFYEDFLEAAMMEAWNAAVSSSETVSLTPDPLDDQKALMEILGDYSTIGLAAGDFVQLVPVTGSPVNVWVISVDSATEATVSTKRGEDAIVSQTLDVTIPEYLEIGTSTIGRSFTVGKSYKDVIHDLTTNEHSQTYTGMLVNGYSISASYGEIVTGTFETLGNGYTQEAGESYEQQIVTAGGTVNPAGTEQPLNASIDFPLVIAGGAATEFCIESLELTFSNNLDPETCIGKQSPQNYTLGTAQIDVSMSAYLSDTSYDALMASKLSLTPLSIGFEATNADGGYSFVLPAVQLSFPDPSSEGLDSQTMIEAAGTAKVGANGESAITVYKLVGDQ